MKTLFSVVVAVTLSMSLPEFIQLKNMPQDERRAHLGLPASCSPIFSAVQTERRARQITVQVGCRPGEDDTGAARVRQDQASSEPRGR